MGWRRLRLKAPLSNDTPTNENTPDQPAGGVHLFWRTRQGSRAGFARFALAEQSSAANRRPPRWQRVPSSGFRCAFPRNSRREPHLARMRNRDATRALRAPRGDPESEGGSPTHARASTSRSSVCRVIARALRNRRLAGLAPERGGSRKVIDFHE
jgi:hypothetical protein